MAHGQGSVIAGRYRLERELARGGMGSVWAAYDDKLRRKVAVKLLMPSSTATAGSTVARRRFEREAIAVAKLQSPHVVQLFDYGVDCDCPFMVMELLAGEDLRTRLHREKRLTLEAAGRMVLQAAKGLSVAHAAGIVHRDLKPGNIFMVRGEGDEIVKILDFGVAKYVAAQAPELDHDTKDGSILGTPQFMAPEQARGVSTVDHRADLWSLGIIMFKALTGQLPFNGQNAADLIVKLCTAEPPSALELAPDLPPEADPFFQKALARDPEQRFGSARELAVAFTHIAPVPEATMSMPAPRPDLLALLKDTGLALPRVDPLAFEEPTSVRQDDEATSLRSLGEAPREIDEEAPTRLQLPPSAVAPAKHEPATLEGGLSGGSSQRPPSLPALRQRDRTWLLALAAIAAGVLIAVAGSLVVHTDAPHAAIAPTAATAATTTTASSNVNLTSHSVSPGTATTAATATTTAAKPSAVSRSRSASEAEQALPAESAQARRPKPEPSSSTATASSGAPSIPTTTAVSRAQRPPEPKAKPKAPAADPFAERL